jgi:hypothetical protein
MVMQRLRIQKDNQATKDEVSTMRTKKEKIVLDK